MTTGPSRGSTDSGGSDALVGERRAQLESAVGEALAARDAGAFVHVGSGRDPILTYCRASAGFDREVDGANIAIGYDGDEWLVRSASGGSAHPAAQLATALVERGVSGTVLTPSTIPHDAALYLENEGLSLASSDVVARARAEKTAAERDRIASVQAAASAGIRRAAAVLAEATVDGDGNGVSAGGDGNGAGDDGDRGGERLVTNGAVLTAERLRIAIDEAIVSAGAFPADNTTVEPTGDLRAGEPIVLAVAPRGSEGYHGRLVRTLVVDSDGGRERRAHVAVTQAFRSSRAMLTAGTESVTAVEADLEAEIRAFGEGGGIETTVAGVGLEPAERPLAGSDDVAPGSVVRLEAAVELADGSWLRLADVLEKRADGVSWLASPSRSLEPTALLED